MNWFIGLLVVCGSVTFLSLTASGKCTGGDKPSCPGTYTCCELKNGSHGCCPIEDAICCADSKHCCPKGYACDVTQGICQKEAVSLLEKIPALAATNELGSTNKVVCASGERQCPAGHTCCALPGSNQFHCCRGGYTCENGLCSASEVKVPATALVFPKSLENIVKCNQETACPDEYTCCKNGDEYVCCPKAQATCCSDHKHCCPRGFVCLPDSKTCTSGFTTIAALLASPAIHLKSKTVLKPWKQKLMKVMQLFFDRTLTKSTPAGNSVICSGGQSQCPDSFTCCMLPSGQWGCCPHPNAVCCSDHVHCCPQGYTCDVSAGTCTRGNDEMAMFTKVLAKSAAKTVNSVVCPDGQSQCPDGSTCCKLASGGYGCCPLPKAVCCSDGVHCCPSGYTCDVSAGTCTRGSKETALFRKVLAKSAVKTLNSVVCPDGQSECPDGNTCCKLASGQYGCCPLPNAVCCSDGVHCCPNGYTCDVSKCARGSKETALFRKVLAKPAAKTVNSVVCPDGQSECPDGNTCCKLASGQYGCCPLPNAVCCSDGVHCCPNGYTCDVSAGTCTRGSKETALFRKVLAKPAAKTVNSVVCPDGQSECPDGNTCCKLASGQYGCCPLPNAVCCSDGVHCCPNGYTCDVSAGTCTRGSKETALFRKVLAKPAAKTVNSVVCPDGQSECPDGNTCCKLASGQYGCCPLPNAVCCSDGVHCCPNGYTCDVSAGTCSRGSKETALFRKVLAKPAAKTVNSVVCPDGQSECPDGNTCCKLASGQYGCCPLPNAVCCSDGVHCCPNGYTCDVSAGTCTRGSKETALLRKVLPKPAARTVNSVVCPDGQSECPDGNTCCKLASGQYGCCPLPNAVCCSDGVHCCPNGYTCDISAGTCSRGSKETALFRKVLAEPAAKTVNSVVCPDGQSECPDGNTCCKLSSGQYGCCPLPNAVCCSDGVHCCPNGYTCDVSTGTCTRGSKETALLRKVLAEPEKTVNSVVCPDGQSECPDGNTCCKLSSGQWGCCPLPDAVCCSDGKHCCLNGYTCDVSAGTCTRGRKETAMFSKVLAKKTSKIRDNIICPDGQSECPDGNTCCKLSSGQWGCCPLPNAVCCSDGVHCCPNGYTCDVSKCARGSKETALFRKVLAKPAAKTVNSVVCPDGQSECPDGNTCCKLSSGQWGCCPLPNAVCCSDGVHCCPNGYTCDVSAGTCTRGSKETALLRKVLPKPAAKTVNSVVCPDGQSECPDGNTCCKLSSGQWGCCPLPNAVCCSDGVHCCPNGYTCDVSKCARGSKETALFRKVLAKPAAKTVNSVVCPDGQSECPDGNTCCKLSSGQWGCCPLPKAVCCSDGVHCCPNGYTCDVSKCARGSKETALFRKVLAKPAAKTVNSVVCPDGQSECPDGNTCCKLSSGQWGCCPLPKAVCCSDGVHCCPNGYTCDVSAGKCTRGSKETALFTKVLAKSVAKTVNSVVCPDGESQCPDGNTCCKLSSGGYGCCPLPNAVCCSDGVHCCPNGYTCDVSAGTCTRGSKETALFTKVLAKSVAKTVNSVVCPDGQSQCPDGNTCCKLSSGGYGCCPLPNAVCCSDGVHCCPCGYKCDVSAGTCTRGGKETALFTKVLAKSADKTVNSVVCPDGQSQCPDGNTCCKLSSGGYGCCPLPNAVCCSDGVHCCPCGYKCDVSAGTCTRGGKETALFTKVLAKSVAKTVNSVVCPDGQSQCPDGNTCCKLSSGGYGCCPLPKAVCCSDGVHCCPSGYTCDVSAGTCTRGSKETALFTKVLPKSADKTVNSVVCPDGESQCPDGSTCCKLSSGGYGCCPLPNAVCCSDGVHCCPNGYTCDVSKCARGSKETALFRKVLAKPAAKTVNSVVCPDGQSECPDGNTCCKLSSGQWGCCPLPDAVCCSDGKHCCPNGYTCDVSAGTCTRGRKETAMFSKVLAKKTSKIRDNIICPDGQSECPDGNTCCKLSSGQWGCCPLPNAVCCSDGVHCCPNGYTCDVSKCARGSKETALFRKVLAKPAAKTVNSVVCPDGQSECPDGNTCCKLSSGQWGCCPLPKAVCCSDGVHCCPNGYTCDVSKCARGSKETALFRKVLAKPAAKTVNSVVCPDGQSECPDGNTCCKLSSGQWGCCPPPKAVCCSDGVHCCPNGYTCDVSAGTCTRGSKETALFTKVLAKSAAKTVNSVVCPDGESQCPDGNTCCKLSSGGYGCCPLPNAVCCSDGVHCCPNGYTCDVSAGTCTRGSKETALFTKVLARSAAKTVNSVVCPDGESQCPDGSTCCKLSSGGYGCCPLPKAVCCSDGVHCCPNGYTCDVSAGTCTRGNDETAMFSKLSARPAAKTVNSVVCPDGESQCPDGNTCCKLSSGGYGCCPLPNAVCCSDGVHCCPNGYTCDVSAGTCTRGSKETALFTKVLAKSVAKTVNSVVCPDGESQCPDGNTCCKLSSGGYGCCPLPKAVCCSDGVHCCPNGYTCDVSAGTCTRGSKETALFTKVLAKSVAKTVNSVVCPDGQSQCPDGNTCCKLSSGGYGCCPLPNAVCCSDGEHCCPQGYKCHVSNGSCIRNAEERPPSRMLSAMLLSKSLKSVYCNDGYTECPNKYTCCKLPHGGFGCCPLPNAVCCTDGEHCCPHGYKCNVVNNTCYKGDSAGLETIEMFVKSLARPRTDVFADVICPDKKSSCPAGNTCCQLGSGVYGCCPLADAVCCSDHVHCCPKGYTCDVKQGKCNKEAEPISTIATIPVRRNQGAGAQYVPCPDGSECLDYETCCELPGGSYGCCPLAKAVCCSDHEHCCPCGYRCDLPTQTCRDGSVSFPWLNKNSALRRTQPKHVNLDEKLHFAPGPPQPDEPLPTRPQQECGLYQTPCSQASGGLFCCPLPNASCCADGAHCCPQGFSCDQKSGKCAPVKKRSLPWFARP